MSPWAASAPLAAWNTDERLFASLAQPVGQPASQLPCGRSPGSQQPSPPWQRAVRGPHRSPSLGRRWPSGRSPLPACLLPHPSSSPHQVPRARVVRSHICVLCRMFSCLGPLCPPPPGLGAPEGWCLTSILHLFLPQYFPGQPLVQNFLHSVNDWLQKQQRKKIPYGFFQTALENRKEVSRAAVGDPLPSL